MYTQNFDTSRVPVRLIPPGSPIFFPVVPLQPHSQAVCRFEGDGIGEVVKLLGCTTSFLKVFWGKKSKPTKTLTKENNTCICNTVTNTPTKYIYISFFNTHVFLPTIIHFKTYNIIIFHDAIVSIYHVTKNSFQDVFPCVTFNT